MNPTRVGALGLLVTVVVPGTTRAQGYRLRIDSRVQVVSYRGFLLDSVATIDTVTGPGGGPQTPGGFAVNCGPAAQYCFFFRPGPDRRGAPFVTTTDLTLWGLGVPGLSVRTSARLDVDLGESNVWPGTGPAVQLLEGYGEYSSSWITGRAGRQIVPTRLSYAGFDGGLLTLRDSRRGVELSGYLGWGLGRASVLPVTSPVLNPLNDFQPIERQLVAGGALGWTGRYADARLDYLREVDRGTHGLVSERAALSASLRPASHWILTGGAEYDLAQGWFGSADGSLHYASRLISASAGGRRYRPFFDLWTIWGAFSPVPYTSLWADASVSPWPSIQIRGRAERYWFADASVQAPLVQAESDGWRASWSASYAPSPRWTLDAGYHAEFGPGASSLGWQGSVRFSPTTGIALTVQGATLNRPLEFRFDDANVKSFGLDAEWSPSASTRFGVGAARYREERRRPDAAAFNWSQTRVQARVTLLFSSGADRAQLPPAIRRGARR